MIRSRSAAALILVSLVVSQSCGEGTDGTTPMPSPDSLVQAEDSTVVGEAGLEQAPLDPADSAAAAPDSAQEVSAAAPDSVQEVSPEALSIEERLDRIARAQEATAARLDSLLGLGVTQAESDQGAAEAAGEVLGQARDQVRSFGVGVIWTIVVMVLFTYLIKSVTWLLDTLAERSATRRLFYKKLAPIVRIVLWIFAAYLVIRVIFRVDAQGIIAAAAAVGVAVGFAAQDLLKNLFGGLILVFDQPFQVGDKISVGGTYGEVVSIGLRSTRLVTPDDNLVSVPNAQVVDGQVANANAGELNCQVVTDLYLPGWVDESVAKKIAFQAAASSKYVYLNKPIVVLVKDEFKETFLTRIRVKAYVLDPRHEFSFQSDVTERARAGFREAGLVQEGYGLRAWLEVARGPEDGDGGHAS